MVITLPAILLRDLDMQPPLPDDQRRAIASLPYGAATKVLVRSTTDLFGGRRARAFATDTDLGAFWDGSGNGTIVTFLAGGSVSRQLRARADAAPARLLDDLCWLGMSGAPVVERHVVTWEDEAFSRGGYAYLDAGFDPAWRTLLARRHGRLLFAGEHTSTEWQGYMNGAIESGRRAARELMKNPPQ
jgi:monoamine oxidase